MNITVNIHIIISIVDKSIHDQILESYKIDDDHNSVIDVIVDDDDE